MYSIKGMFPTEGKMNWVLEGYKFPRSQLLSCVCFESNILKSLDI